MFPIVIVSAPTESEARAALSDYLLNMYGLANLRAHRSVDAARELAFDLASSYFIYDYEALGLPETFGSRTISCRQTACGWQVEMPRLALVASGRKAPCSCSAHS